MSNGEDSTIVLHDNTRDQQLHVSGASTSAPGHADDVTRGCPRLPTDAPMLMFLTAAGEWERIQEVPASVLDSHNVPDLSRIEREAKQDQQTDAELPERAIDSVTITVNEARRGFGPLKVVLSSIYTDYKVCSRFTVSSSPPINPSTGYHCHRKQDRRPPFTRRCVGKPL